jgi:hypothetical protein
MDLDLDELNPAQKDWLIVKTPKNVFYDVKNIQFDTTTLANANYTIEVVAKDRAGNVGMENIVINVDNSRPGVIFNQPKTDQNFITLIEIMMGIAMSSAIIIITLKKLRISKRS